jgi:hypothetical protein
VSYRKDIHGWPEMIKHRLLMMNGLPKQKIEPRDGVRTYANMMAFPQIVSVFIAWNISS